MADITLSIMVLTTQLACIERSPHRPIVISSLQKSPTSMLRKALKLAEYATKHEDHQYIEHTDLTSDVTKSPGSAQGLLVNEALDMTRKGVQAVIHLTEP